MNGSLPRGTYSLENQLPTQILSTLAVREWNLGWTSCLLLVVGALDGKPVQAGHVLALHVVVRCKLRPERLATAFDSIAAEFKAANAGETQRKGRKGPSLK